MLLNPSQEDGPPPPQAGPIHPRWTDRQFWFTVSAAARKPS